VSSPHNRRAGVTLIEILVAVSILALLSTGILVAMRIGFNTMDKTDAHLIHNRRIVNTRRIIESEIQGFLYTLAMFRPQPDVSPTSLPFREFAPGRMRFVTSYSLREAWRGRAHVLVMQVIPGDNNRGLRLIANEIPWTGPMQSGEMVSGFTPEGVALFAPFEPDGTSFVLADRLERCQFFYQIRRPDGPGFIWVPEILGQRLMPLGIRIDMAPLEANTSELTAMSITVPFPVTRTQGLNYADTF
jgi:prepilin-type N-terminal cleavage/methylation domain-containing protein